MISVIQENTTDRVVMMSRIRRATTKEYIYKHLVDTLPNDVVLPLRIAILSERVDMLIERLQRVEDKQTDEGVKVVKIVFLVLGAIGTIIAVIFMILNFMG